MSRKNEAIRRAIASIFEPLEARICFGLHPYELVTDPTPPSSCPTGLVSLSGGSGVAGGSGVGGTGVGGGGGGGGAGGPTGLMGPPMAAAAATNAPIIPGTGMPIINSTDLESDAFGMPWSYTRTWIGVNNTSQNGNGWAVTDLPYLNIEQNQYPGLHHGIIQLIQNGSGMEEFEIPSSGTTYIPRGINQCSLVYIPPTTDDDNNIPGEFQLTDEMGNVTTFYDVPRDDDVTYSSGGDTYDRVNSIVGHSEDVTHQWYDTSNGTKSDDAAFAYRFGAFKSYTDASGTLTITANYNSETGNLTSEIRTDGSGAYEQFAYTYSTVANSTTGANVSLVSSVSLQKGSSSEGPWTTVRTATYQYYTGDGSDSANGRLGDLKLVNIFDGESASTLTSLTQTSGTATATLNNHGFSVGDQVLIQGADQSDYNGTFTITAATTNTFSFAVAGSPTSPATGAITVSKSINTSYYRYYKFHTYSDAFIEDNGGSPSAANVLTADNDGDTLGTGGSDMTFPAQDGDNDVYSGLKTVVFGANFARLAANYSSYDSMPDVDTVSGTDSNSDGDKTNDDVRSYANNYFRYERYNLNDVQNIDRETPIGRYRVVEETAAAAGCSTCSAGLGTTKFVYSVNPDWKADAFDSHSEGLDPNKWVMKTVESLPDDTNTYGALVLGSGDLTSSSGMATVQWADQEFSIGDYVTISGATDGAYDGTFQITSISSDSFTYALTASPTSSTALGTITATASGGWSDNDSNIIYTNEIAQLMLSVQIDANGTSDTADDKQYLTYQHYDLPDIATGNNGDHLDYVVDPSAITGYDKDSDDLVHFGTTDFIQPNQGRIEHMVYFDGTTTASESAGDVNGYLQATFLQHGYDDESPVQILGQDYYSHTYHGATVYPVANEYVYYNGDPEATNHTYTWALDGSSDETNRIQSEAITYPSNSSAQNGPDDNDVTTTVFDAVGRPVWSMDEDGFISYTQYDSSTGALVKQIQDVDTSSTGEFSGKPDGWTTPSGGGLNLIITMQVDNLGRTTKLTDPNGNVTYTVYDDVNHESRIYRGWTGTTTTGPIIVNRQNWPIVGASVGERTVYFETLTSSATPTVDGSGVPTGQETVNSSNIQSLTRTLTNDAGQKTEVDRYPTLSGVTYSATPYLGTAGTNYYATLIAYDGRGRVKRVLAPTGTITRYLYDVRGLLTSTWVGTDDIPSTMGVYWSPAMPSGTNLVKVSENVYDFGLTGDGNLTSMTTYPGGDADPRVTEMFYDWRDRLVIEKDGTQASESTSRPLTYWDYNDQNQVISRREYDGEGVLTDPPPPTIANSSFETPPETEEVDEPTVTSWTFDGGNGVTGIVPKDFFGFDTPDGSNQFARMNTDSDSTSAGPTISQTFTNDYAGRFKFGFEAEQDGAADAAIEIELRIDGTVIGTFTPNYGIFAAFYASTDLSAGSHTITLQAFSSTEFAFAEGWLDAVSVSLDTSRDDLNSDGIPDVPSSSLLRAKTTYSYDDQGRVYRSSTFSVDPSDGTVSTDALNINYFYDHRGNVIKVSQPGGLVYKYQYDGADRVTKTYTTDGADSRTGNSGSLDGTWAQAADIVGDHVLEQTENQYDADGNVIFTITKQRFDNAIPGGELGNPSSTSPTPRARDYYVENYYDALDRLTGTADLGTNDGTVLSSRPDSVLPSASDDVLTNSYEYQTDELQSIQITGSPTSGSFKLVFEGDETSTSITYGASALTVQGVLEDLGTIGPGNVSVTKDATSGVYRVTFTGDLANKHLPQITATSASFVGGMSPGVSVNTIVTGSSGWLSKATDPRGIVSLSDYDMLGRSTRTIAAFTDGVPTDADDQTTDYTYDGDDHVLTMTAKLPGDAFQTTEYIYDATQSDSNLNSNDILTAIEYPDVDSGEASSDEKESFTVNALGERTSYTDRDGTTHSYGYDVLGRLTSDNVTGHLGGVDDAVTKLGYSYDSQGLLEKATSYNSSGGVVNQVEDAYNGLGQLITEYQEHSGAVNISTSSKVQYTYNEMADDANNSRITSITYPDGRETDYLYSTTVDNRISRLTGVAQVIHTGDPELGDTVNWYEIYSYLGLNTIIRRARPEPNITLTYAKLTGELDGGAGDQYVGLDRFGRVVDQRWFDSSHDDVDRFQYGYDRDGNVLFKLNVVNTSDSELYTYDNLNRLITFERGTLNSSKDGITGTPSNSQSWSLDAAGNWISATLYGFPQSIENNQQNEMTENGSTSQTYSGNGNLITDDHGNLISYTYDAWNRLVGYNYDDENDDHDIQAYAYDALGTRIQMLTLSPDTRDGHEGEYFASNTIDLYYNDNWQVVQENTKDGFINSDDTPPIIDTDGEMAPTYDYLWSPVLPDSLIWRGEDDDFDGVTDTRLYAQQDANGNVTSTSDSSGDIDTRYLYDPYGNATVLDSSWSSTSNIFGWVYMYQDQRLDPATGLYSMRMRDYSPDLGRFIQADPAGYVNGANRYAFVGDSPEGRTDPMGLDYTVDEDSGSGGNAGRAAMPSIYRRPILPPPPPQQPINPNPNGPELLGDPSGKPSNHGDATPTTQPGTGSSPATCPCATSTQPASAPGVPIIWKLGDRDPDVRAQGSKELEKYNMQDIWDEYVKGGHSLTELIALQAAYKAKLASGAHWDDPGWVSHFEDFLAVNGQEAKTCDELKYWYYEYLGIDPAHTKEKDIDRMSLIYWEQGRWESDWTNGGEIAQ